MRVLRWVAAVLAAALALVAAQAAASPRGGELDGFTIGYLPDQIDDQTSVSDFDYEWGGVSFSSRVWETTLEGEGPGWSSRSWSCAATGSPTCPPSATS